MRVRRLAALAAAAAALVLVVSTSGFSAVSAERPVEVRVVENENAFVGVQACERSGNSGNGTSSSENGNNDAGRGNPVAVRLTNRLTGTLDGANVIGYAADGSEVERTSSKSVFADPVPPGESSAETLTFENSVEELRVRTSTTDASVSVSVTVDVEPKSTADCPLSEGNG